MNMYEIKELVIKTRNSYQQDINNVKFEGSLVWKQAKVNVGKLNQVIEILNQ